MVMVNFTRLQMLTVGAVRQMAQKLELLSAELSETKKELALLENGNG